MPHDAVQTAAPSVPNSLGSGRPVRLICGADHNRVQPRAGVHGLGPVDVARHDAACAPGDDPLVRRVAHDGGPSVEGGDHKDAGSGPGDLDLRDDRPRAPSLTSSPAAQAAGRMPPTEAPGAGSIADQGTCTRTRASGASATVPPRRATAHRLASTVSRGRGPCTRAGGMVAVVQGHMFNALTRGLGRAVCRGRGVVQHQS